MKNFFILQRPNKNYQMSNMEQFIPIIIMILIIVLLVVYRNKIRRNDKIEKMIRYTLTGLSSIIFIFYYLITWLINGVKVDNLPIHLCYIVNILCIILGFTKSKKIYDFVICYGVIGGVASLISMDTSLSSMYLKYYQFMISHISIIVIPIYFLLVHRYYLKEYNVIKLYLLLQVMGFAVGIFNHKFNTNYFFVLFNSNLAAKGTILEGVGEGYNYFINLEVLVLIYTGLIYLLAKVFNRKIKHTV
ncbi:TIGR02206 family membrane protein [Clostridium sp. DSM 100503]|uniref:YwaF family protein n=1 Tax=Clostridium sp. DSM 100503 TaxID=2963282 RepID=UPI00214A635A|nr:TIGR02206 family membrane protein [Clostridium sp. DSM 100503]MCR1951692.1 TIGR02206 family membrane protein [Clostridium sp. DSM 100503]